MAVYQVAIIFKSIGDEDASRFAEHIRDMAKEYTDTAVVSDAKISFVKFEEEQDETVRA